MSSTIRPRHATFATLIGLSPSFPLVDGGSAAVRVSIRPVFVRRPIDRIEMDTASLARHEEGLP